MSQRDVTSAIRRYLLLRLLSESRGWHRSPPDWPRGPVSSRNRQSTWTRGRWRAWSATSRPT